MPKLVHTATNKEVKVGDAVTYRSIVFAVYQINIRPSGYCYVTLNPDEGGHPLVLLPTDIGMQVV